MATEGFKDKLNKFVTTHGGSTSNINNSKTSTAEDFSTKLNNFVAKTNSASGSSLSVTPEVETTPKTTIVSSKTTPQLRTTLAQQIKNGTAPSIQDKAKNNTLKQTVNNIAYGSGNINLLNRDKAKNPDGSISTVRSLGVNIDGKEVLIPTVIDGKVVSDEEAIQHYKDTGEYLGKFNTVEESNNYANKLHQNQEKFYSTPLSKYLKTYQTVKDNEAKVNAEIKASGLDFTDEEKQLLRSGNYSINRNYKPNDTFSRKIIDTGVINNENVSGNPSIESRIKNASIKAVNTAFDLVGKGAAGVTQGLEGLADFGVASVGNSLSDLTSARGLLPNKVSEGIRSKTENFVKKNLGMSEFVDEISEEKGGIYNPKILGVPVRNAVQEVARMFTTSVLGGLPTMMASAAGSSTEEALNEGENLSNAYKYGVTSGAIEGATEKMFDAANLFGGGAVSKLSGKISRTFAGKVLEATAGEGVEEMVSQALNPFVKMITYKGKTENPFGSWENFKNYLKDIGTAGYEGAIIGGFTLGMSAPGNVELQKSFSNDVYKAVDKLQGIDQVRKNEIANAIIEGTKSVTGEDIKNIRSFVENYKKTSGIQQQNAPSTISKENVTGLPKSSLYNSPTTQLQKPSNETISNQVKTAQNVNTGVTEQNSLKTEPKTEEMSSKNELNKKLFDERMELFDELVKKGYAEYKTVNKSTEMFRTDKWNNEADQIYKKIEKLFNEEYYPSTVTDSAKQSQAIASLPTQNSIIIPQGEWENTTYQFEYKGKPITAEVRSYNPKTDSYFVKANIKGNVATGNFMEIPSTSFPFEVQQELNKYVKASNGILTTQAEQVSKLPTQKSVENVQEMGYNKYLRKTDKVAKYEYNQVQSEVMTWHSKEADGVHLIDLSKNGYKSYIYNKDGDSIEIIKRVDADEDTINTIRKEIENGTYNEPKALNQYLENVKNEIRRNRASSSQLPNRVRNDTNVGENNRNARTEERNNRTRIDENNSRNLKDSNKSSFSMSENSIKDNKGRILTKEQQEFFKDSKVRDENGNLLEVYHGTNVDFDVFDKKKTGTNFTYSKGGFFFTSKNSQAKSYGKYVKSCYLNMLNPLIRKSPSLVNPTDFYDTNAFMQEAITENNDGIIIKGTGEYQDETLYVAFKPEQIKFIDDLPTQKSVENNGETVEGLYKNFNSANEISQFKSSENGRPYMNLNKEISTNNESKNNRTGLSEIESVINEIVPVRHGKFRQKAYGIYKNRGEIIRIKQKNDIPVALHKLTHHLDKQLGLSKTGKFDSELIPIAVVSDSANIDTKRAEGVAEFGRYYMTDPEYAKSIAPTYFEAFEENLKQSPQMYAKVEQLQNMVSDYLRQSPLNRVLSHIDYGDDTANIFTKAKDRALEFKKSFRKNFFDDLDPLKQVINDITDGKKLAVDEDAYAKLRLNRGVTGKVQVALEYGITDNNGKKIGKSLTEIIAPVQNDIDGFVAYISALRAKDLETRNVESGFNSKDIDNILSEYGDNEAFNKASDELYKYQNQILEKTLVDSGIITKDALKAYNEANPHYVPFYRVMDENFKQSKDSMSKSPKRIKGSTRDIINPLESIIKNTYSYYMISEKNNAYKSLFSLANEYDGTGKWFDRVPTDMTGQKVTANDVKEILDKLDLDKSDVDYNELFTTIFKPSNYQKGNIVTVMDKGKPVHYEIMDESLYKVLASSSKKESPIIKFLSAPPSALRVGATHTLEFTLRNPIKDTFDAFTYSKNNFIPVVDTVIGIFNVAGKSDLYYKWLESGGSGSSYTNAQRTTLRNTLKGIMPAVYSQSKVDTLLDMAKHPLQTYLNLIGELSNVTEEGTRVGEFRRALKNNKAVSEAALESRDITVDFSKGGEITKEANKLVAFLNANVQGLDKMFTAFKERPVATTIKGIAAFMLPSMLIAGLTGEDDRDKVPQWEKDSHWIFFINGTPVRIPKPQGVGGAFANLGESIVDYMRKKDPEIFKHFMFETLLSYMPVSDISSIMPNALLTPLEVAANKSFFKDSKIVPQSMENRSPEYQYDEYTSTIAKQIGKTFKVSPKQVDYLISGCFGNLGKDVATLLGLPFDAYENATSGKKKTYTTTNAALKKIPLIKGFIANDYANPKLDKFYENKSQALTDYTDVKFKYADKLDADTITDKVIDSSKLNAKEKKELKQAKNINSLYNSAYNKIKDKNEEIDKIEQGKGSNQFKKVQIDKVNKEINKILEQVEKDVETYKKRGTLPTKDD